MTRKEQAFFDALRDVFVGAEVEGESGFVNLMRIKSRYYERGVFPRLQRDIGDALLDFPQFRDELFDRLYTFFRRYFSESGSIYFRFTPPHEHVYERIYSDEWDVALFWKTHMLYYVKTDRLFHDMTVEVDGHVFFFDVSALEHKQANEKRSLMYGFEERREDGTLVFTVSQATNGRKTDTDVVRRAIRDALGLSKYTRAVPSTATLERAFRLFERQSEVDFFINRDARRFLREQFNLWLYQYVFEPEEERGTAWTEQRIRQLQVLKETAYKVIDFIAQFEDELVRIWNKPKFVLESHYVLTLDRIAAQEGGMEVVERLLADPGMTAQVREWRELGMVGEEFMPEEVWAESDLMGARLHDRYRYLPVDTRHFPDLEMAIVALFDHLDQALDGWLVHSENYQALRTLLPKFRGGVKCIYIDPPYNTGSDEFIYNDHSSHSSWLTMMENRLRLAREWLRDDGAIFVSIDDNEHHMTRTLLARIMGDENFKNSIVVRRGTKSVQAQFEDVDALNVGHEYVLLFGKSDRTRFPKVLVGNGREHGDWNNHWRGTDRPTMRYELFGILPERGQWRWSRERSLKAIENYRRMVNELGGDEDSLTQEQIDRWWQSEYERTGKGPDLLRLSRSGKPEHYIPPSAGRLLSDLWEDVQASNSKELTAIFGKTNSFPNPKSVKLVERIVTLSGEDVYLDFFAGSGTTAHAVINLNREDGGRRRYILVEMADYFHTVLLPRVKKAIFSSRWKDGRAQPSGKGISQFVKYFRLEQYEEVLRKARYEDVEQPQFFDDPYYKQYVFLRDTKMLDNAETGEKVMEVDLERNEIQVHLDRLYPEADLAETLSCLTGRRVRRVHPAPDDPTRPGTVEFEDGGTVDLQNPPWEMVKPLIWW